MSDAEITQVLDYRNHPTVQMPVITGRHREARSRLRPLEAVRRNVVRAARWLYDHTDDIVPPLVGVVVGLLIDLAVCWWVWQVYVVS